MVKTLYKLFLGVMVALFIGFGVSVFYPGPTAPEYPTELQNIGKNGMTTAQEEQNATFEKEQKAYQAEFAKYSQNVSAIVICFSIVLLILSLTVLLKIEIIGDGILLGGLLTLLYGIIRAFMSESSRFQFGVVTVGLVVALILGYWKFLRPEAKKSLSK